MKQRVKVTGERDLSRVSSGCLNSTAEKREDSRRTMSHTHEKLLLRLLSYFERASSTGHLEIDVMRSDPWRRTAPEQTEHTKIEGLD